MPESESRKIVDGGSMIDCFPPYYPDEDRQLAAELMALASQLMDMASRVIKPDHYWKGMPSNPSDPPGIYPMKDKS